jgi:hypothetical protein
MKNKLIGWTSVGVIAAALLVPAFGAFSQSQIASIAPVFGFVDAGSLYVNTDAGIGGNILIAGGGYVAGAETVNGTFQSNGQANMFGGAMIFNSGGLYMGANPITDISAIQFGGGPTFANGAGSQITNIGIGVCGLSSQTCNAVVPGATGNSVCHAFLLGPNSLVLPCDARADAGSATITCGAATTGDAGVECFN